MDSEQLQNFNERLSQWVANQGFWFQVRYSMSGSGIRGRAMFHLLRMGFRLLVFLLIVAAGVWVYLEKRSGTERFREGLREMIRTGLSAEEIEASRISRSRGRLEVARLAAAGGTSTFFSSLEMRNLRCRMDLTDGVVGAWDPGVIMIGKLDLDLRAGAEDEESAHKLAAAVFRDSETVKLDGIEVASANIRWGYSGPTRGGIEKSRLIVRRTPTGWRLEFKGGRFSQNWLRDLDIVDLAVVCEPSGVLFEKAEFRSGSAKVSMSGLRVAGGHCPEVNGKATIVNLPLEKMIPAAVSDFVEGAVSGEFRVSGSTNTSEGVTFDGRIVLGETDVITLRERIHLLKALSVVDGVRNYKRVDFHVGSFDVKSAGGGLVVNNIDLRSEDLFTLAGALRVRPPSEEERKSAMAGSAPGNGWQSGAGAFDQIDPWGGGLTLRRAAQAASAGTGTAAEETSLFDKIDEELASRTLAMQAAERLSRMLRYEGRVRLSIPGDAFDGAAMLRGQHPKDPATGRILLDVPLEGFLYELTLSQSEELYEQGQR